MTADELRKLAEIAGVEAYQEFDYVQKYEKLIVFTIGEWQPHLRIEQAMMVANKAFGFWQLTRSKTIDDEWRFRVTASYISKEHGCLSVDSGWLSTAELAFCTAALAAAKEE